MPLDVLVVHRPDGQNDGHLYPMTSQDGLIAAGQCDGPRTWPVAAAPVENRGRFLGTGVGWPFGAGDVGLGQRAGGGHVSVTNASVPHKIRGRGNLKVASSDRHAPRAATSPFASAGRAVRLWKAGLLSSAACAVLGMVAGCGGSAGTPASSVLAAYQAANRGDYTAADTYVDPNIFADMSWDMITRNGRLDHVAVVSSDVSGSTATVVTSDYYTDGCVIQRDVTNLVQEHGQWLVTAGGAMSDENGEC